MTERNSGTVTTLDELLIKMEALKKRQNELNRKRHLQSKRADTLPGTFDLMDSSLEPFFSAFKSADEPDTKTQKLLSDQLRIQRRQAALLGDAVRALHYLMASKSKSFSSDPTQDAQAMDELRKALGVSQAMHNLLLASVGGQDALRDVYIEAARNVGIEPPMFSDNLDKPKLAAIRAGLPAIVAEAINNDKRLNDADILSKIGNSFFFGQPLKPSK